MAGFLKNSQDNTQANFASSVDYVLVEDNAHVVRAAKELSVETLLAVDTENTGIDPHIKSPLLLQVGTSSKCFVFLGYKKLDLAPIKKLLEDPNILKVLFNAKYDWKWLAVHYNIKMKNVFCGQIAERLLTVGRPEARRRPALKDLAIKYLGITLRKEARSGFIDRDPIVVPLTDKEFAYSAADVVLLPEIYYRQLALLKKLEILQVAELEFEVLPAVAESEIYGSLIDQDKWRALLDEAKVKHAAIASQIYSCFKGVMAQKNLFKLPTFNIDSPKQLLSKLLLLGFDLPDTNETTLKNHVNSHEVFEYLLRYRGFNKILTSYGEKFLSRINKNTGRLHANFNQVATDTGRMSSCFPAGTEIITLYGPKSIEAITAGEYVWTRFGFRLVKHQWESGIKDIWEIETSNGEKIKCSGNHPFLSTVGWSRADSLGKGSIIYKSLKTPVIEEFNSLGASTHFSSPLENSIYTELFELNVVSVRNTGIKETVYDLSVEGEEFLVSGVVVHNSNPNLQQVPKFDPDDPDSLDFRSCFIARSGHTLITADFSQQELRILADMSDDLTFLKAYTTYDDEGNELDVHRYTASVIFNIPYNEVNDTQRKRAKILNFFLVYGGGAYALSQSLKLSEEEAQQIIDDYFKRYGKIKEFLDSRANSALNKGYSTTISGRKRFFTLPHPDDPTFKRARSGVRRKGANTTIQGSGADVTKKAMVLLYNKLQELGMDATILMIVHDEFVVEVRQDQAKKAAKIVENEMINGFAHFFKKIPMRVDAHIGPTWEK